MVNLVYPVGACFRWRHAHRRSAGGQFACPGPGHLFLQHERHKLRCATRFGYADSSACSVLSAVLQRMPGTILLQRGNGLPMELAPVTLEVRAALTTHTRIGVAESCGTMCAFGQKVRPNRINRQFRVETVSLPSSSDFLARTTCRSQLPDYPFFGQHFTAGVPASLRKALRPSPSRIVLPMGPNCAASSAARLP